MKIFRRLLIIFSFLLLFTQKAYSESTNELFLRFDGVEYPFEEGPHPNTPKARLVYKSRADSGLARAMDAIEGSDQESIEFQFMSTDVGYHSLGVFVSPPLAGGQTIFPDWSWTFKARTGIQGEDSQFSQSRPAHKRNAFVYLWRRQWPNSHYLSLTPRDPEWIIANQNPSVVTTGSGTKESVTYWNGNVWSVRGSSDGMDEDLTVFRGDRLVLEVETEITTTDGKSGGIAFYYNGTGNASTSLSISVELDFMPYIYSVLDASDNEITETLGSADGEVQMLK
ncbi:MAG: hypothetical protein GX817_06850, partial [Elusimicrobia bacterium]|nr:hypothetical protein [Elusimicrobiota bacterium]